LSEQIIDRIQLDNIGRLLAFTSNDEVNSLAILHFSEFFEREELYQLPPGSEKEGKEEEFSPQHLRGRFLFKRGLDYSTLNKRFYSGSKIISKKFTTEFDFAEFRKIYGESAVPLFLVTENGKLLIFTTDREIVPKSGETLIALVDRY
jgi:hypothetical protein